MAEENIEVVQTSQDTPPAEGNESQPEEQVQEDQVQNSQEGTEGEETQPEHSGESQEEKPDDQSGDQQEAKPSRAERRISQLISKLKETHQSPSEPPGEPARRNPRGFLTQEEIETGEIDPSVLEERLNKEAERRAEQKVQMTLVNQQYETAVKEHEADMDTVGEIDPNIEALAVKQYNALNFQTNPFTGQKVFIPAVKMSEIVQKLSDSVRAAAGGTEESQRRYVEDVEQYQAVPSSSSVTSSKKVSEGTTNFSEFEKAFSPK